MTQPGFNEALPRPNESVPGQHDLPHDAIPAELASGFADTAVVTPGGIWGVWLRLTSPQPHPDDWRDPRRRDRLRRARLLSIFLLGGVLVVLGLVPQAFVPTLDVTQLAVTGSALSLIIVCAIMSRLGAVSIAATILVSGVALAVAANQLFQPGGLPLSGRTAFDLFVIPILLAGVLLPRRMTLIFWVLCSVFIFLDLQFSPKQADLLAFIQADGIYTVAGTPIILLFVVTLVAWLAAGSLRQAVREADRTHELESAYRFIADQKRELEEAIIELQQVHAQAANGDLTARALIANETLRPLSVSLNLMLERLSHARGAELALRGIEQRLQVVEQCAQQLSLGHFRQPLPRQDLGRLAPLTHALESIRSGVLNAFEQQTIFTSQADAAVQLYIRTVRQWILDLQQNSASYDAMETVSQAEKQALRAIERCRQAAERFV